MWEAPKWVLGAKKDNPKKSVKPETDTADIVGTIKKASREVTAHVAPDGEETILVDRWGVEKAEKAYTRRVTRRVFNSEWAVIKVRTDFPVTGIKQSLTAADILALAKVIEADGGRTIKLTRN